LEVHLLSEIVYVCVQLLYLISDTHLVAVGSHLRHVHGVNCCLLGGRLLYVHVCDYLIVVSKATSGYDRLRILEVIVEDLLLRFLALQAGSLTPIHHTRELCGFILRPHLAVEVVFWLSIVIVVGVLR